MKVLILGATGSVGRIMLAQALARERGGSPVPRVVRCRYIGPFSLLVANNGSDGPELVYRFEQFPK